MKIVKWIIIIAVILVAIFLLKDLAGHEKKHIEEINAKHAATAEKYTIGIEKNLKQKINQAVNPKNAFAK
ncbi:MAG: hypothetical protein ACP5JP_07445 [bacterium]